MAVGQLNKIKVGFVIQARMESSRLPKKVLMPIPIGGDKPLIGWIIDRVKQSKFSNTVIVATSENRANDLLENYCTDKEVGCFRGNEENVLSRYIEIIKSNDFDVVVRLTGDNPILDLEILEDTIEKHVRENNDYTKTEGLPIGMNFEVVKPSALLLLETKELSQADKEHVTLYLRSDKTFNCSSLLIDEQIDDQKNMRLTVDLPSDFLVVSSLLSQVTDSNLIDLNFVVDYWKRLPWVFDINKENYQKKQFKNEEEEMKTAISFLNKNDFNGIADKLSSML